MKLAVRIALCALLFAAVANAFQAPALKSRVAGSRAAVNMGFEDVAAQAADSTAVQLTNVLLAAKETDFGGYIGPGVGLLVLCIAIAALTNPYDDLKQ